MIPGTLGDNLSALQDSFTDDLLDYPHYTRPKVLKSISVPEVLVSGDHNAINRWRLKQALGRTFERRPDLIERKELSDDEQNLLQEYQEEIENKS